MSPKLSYGVAKQLVKCINFSSNMQKSDSLRRTDIQTIKGTQ